jgi:hypothetical protein
MATLSLQREDNKQTSVADLDIFPSREFRRDLRLYRGIPVMSKGHYHNPQIFSSLLPA